jgi:transcriptional regulator GlxA family with amidase domain
MTTMRPPVSVAFAAVPHVTGSTLYGMYDLFCSAGRDWNLVVKGEPGTPLFAPVVTGRSLQTFEGGNGVPIRPQRTFDDMPDPDIVCVPEVLVAPSAFDPALYADALGWLRRCHARGSIVAGVCSGTMLMAAAGLLDDQDATSHWGYCDELALRYPRVRMSPARVLVTAGEGQRLVTAGGGSSWNDLALYLVARLAGIEEAVRLAKLYLIDWHKDGQLPFAALARTRQVDDPAIAKAQLWIAEHYAAPAPVAGMQAAAGLAERTFNRRFQRATGMGPLEYTHTLRLEEAKQLLETAAMPVEAVAQAVGYEDPGFFARLFRRKVGLTPGQYRRRFAHPAATLVSRPG